MVTPVTSFVQLHLTKIEIMKTTLVLIVLCVSGALGQEPLTLRDAVRLAVKQNKSLESSTAAESASQARIAEARSGLLPRVNYSESWARSDNPVFVFSSLLTQHQFGAQNFAIGSLNRPDFLNNFQSQLTADQPLYDAGKTKRATRTAEISKTLRVEETRRIRMEVIAGVVRAYFDAQLGVEQLDATHQAMRSAEADLTRAEARRSAGMTTDVDVLSIRVHLAAVREQEQQRLADLDVAKASLNDWMALPLDSPHSLATKLSPLPLVHPSLAAYEAQSASQRPETLQTKSAKDLSEIKAKEARASLLPEVSAHAAFEADRQRFYDRGGANWLVSIGLRWNLFNGFGDKARIAEAEAGIRQASADQQRADSAVRMQVRRAWAFLNAAEQRMETAKATVAEAEESLRISQNRYDAGLATITDLLRVETALLETRTRYVAAVHDQRVGAALLELAAGTISTDSEVLN